MSRKVNLRDDGDSTGGSIGNDLSDLVLSIKKALAVRSPVEDIVLRLEMAHKGFFPDRTLFGQTGIFLYFYPPSLVIGKMPVEAVELMHLHHVQIAFHLIHTPEMAGYVKVHSAIGKSRSILYHHAFQLPVFVLVKAVRKDFFR